MSQQLIYYCVTVDTEEEWDWFSGFPTGPASVENIHRLPDFQEMCQFRGAAVTYFANHAVLANRRSAAILRGLAQRPGVEIGLHIHPWNTPPLADAPFVPSRQTYLHNLPWSEAQAKIDTTWNAFLGHGLRPTSFRGGRYSTSPQIQAELRDRGVIADASILPYLRWHDDGAPVHSHRTLTPLRHPPRNPDDSALWELPLTAGYSRQPFGFWRRVLRLADTPLGRACHLTGILDRLGIVSLSWLNFENPLGWDLLGFLEVLERIRPPFVCFTLHSSSLLPGGSPYARTQADVDRINRRIDQTLQAISRRPAFHPATVSDTARYLEVRHQCESSALARSTKTPRLRFSKTAEFSSPAERNASVE